MIVISFILYAMEKMWSFWKKPEEEEDYVTEEGVPTWGPAPGNRVVHWWPEGEPRTDGEFRSLARWTNFAHLLIPEEEAERIQPSNS